MSTNKKPRADAKLKTLPEERQAGIAAYARDHSLADTLKWLKEDGLVSSLGALSQFLSWYAVRARSEQREQKIQAWLECEKLEHPELTEEELFKRGQRKFQIISIAEEDAEAWAKVQKTGRDKEALALDRLKFQRETCDLFIHWFEDKRAREIASSGGSNADKIERLGQLMFGEDWKR